MPAPPAALLGRLLGWAWLWNALGIRNFHSEVGLMPCDAEILKHVPLFALLDEEELAVLAGQVELENSRPANAFTRWERPADERTCWFPGRWR